MVTFHASVHDGCVALLPDSFPQDLVVGPIGESPHAFVDLAELTGPAGIIRDRVLERFVEVTVVQEDIRVVIPPVEVPFDRLHRLDNTVQFLVSRQNDERCVCPGATVVNVETAGGKDFIMLFANFSIDHGCQQSIWES